MQSLESSAVGISIWDNSVEFAGDSSLVSVFAPDAQLFDSYNGAKVLNNSNPSSKCILNGEAETCHL